MEKKEFYAHGKLLLTGEYAVLDGALSLALPTRYGQHMEVSLLKEQRIHFRSLTMEGSVWFEEDLFTGSDNPIAQTLERILREAQRLQADFLLEGGAMVTTRLEFPKGWGLGSSSTLIAMLAQWAGVDPYQLLWNSFAHYKAIKKHKASLLQQLTHLTEAVYRCRDKAQFATLITEHEALLSTFLQLPTVKERLFADFAGAIKSLGAWGGDFVLVVGEEDYVRDYFTSKGFDTLLSFKQMILPTDREPILPPSPQGLL